MSKAIIEAQEELGKIEDEFSKRLLEYHERTGLLITRIDIEWLKTTKFGEQYETAIPKVKIEIIIKRG